MPSWLKSGPQNPYRFLFPVGCVNGILGASLWLAFRWEWIAEYPIVQHANLMIGGFIFSYALGFLWTAVPRFFQAPSPSWRELLPLVAVAGLTPFLGILKNPLFFYMSLLLNVLLTIRFGVSRFHLRKSAPFPSFLFVASGLVLVSLSLLVLAIASVTEVPAPLASLARTFFLKGFSLFLYLGIGTKLVPTLSGWAPMPQSGPKNFTLDPLFGVVIAALLIAFWLEAAGMAPAAGAVYGTALVTVGLFRMRFARLPQTKSALAVFVWLSSLFISMAPFSLLIDRSYATHFWHLVFMSGLGLLTIFVSLRVTLAHSDRQFLEWERRPAFFFLGGLVLLGAVTRVSAPFTPNIMWSHYAYAAGAWILALLLWAFYFGITSFGPPDTQSSADEC